MRQDVRPACVGHCGLPPRQKVDDPQSSNDGTEAIDGSGSLVPIDPLAFFCAVEAQQPQAPRLVLASLAPSLGGLSTVQ